MARGRQAGAKKYQNPILYKCIKKFKPIAVPGWTKVANKYMRDSGESILREVDDI